MIRLGRSPAIVATAVKVYGWKLVLSCQERGVVDHIQSKLRFPSKAKLDL